MLISHFWSKLYEDLVLLKLPSFYTMKLCEHCWWCPFPLSKSFYQLFFYLLCLIMYFVQCSVLENTNTTEASCVRFLLLRLLTWNFNFMFSRMVLLGTKSKFITISWIIPTKLAFVTFPCCIKVYSTFITFSLLLDVYLLLNVSVSLVSHILLSDTTKFHSHLY